MSNEMMKTVLVNLKALIKIKTQKDFDPDMVQLFLDALADQNPEDLLRAIRLCAKENTYGIQPSDILKHLENSEEDYEMKASKIASMVFDDYQHKMLEGRGEIPVYDDEIIRHAFRVTRQENDWKEDGEAFQKYFRRNMKSNLMNLFLSPSYNQSLQLKEADEKEERLKLYE